MRDKISVSQIVAGLHPSLGGPTRTVIQLSDSLSLARDIDISLITQSKLGDLFSTPNSNKVKFEVAQSANSLCLSMGIPGRQKLVESILKKKPNLIHINGVWHPLSHWSALAGLKYDIPYIIQPRGMLAPWALSWHSKRKLLAMFLYQRRDLELASLFVATADEEAENIRRLGLRQPIAVIPNGINLSFERVNYPEVSDSSIPIRKMLFLSRIHPKKGLINALKAWASLRTEGWIFQIAGPDECCHLNEVLLLATQLGIQEQVQYLGEFDDDTKWRLYQEADLFLLPSYSENFGVVVLEALYKGLPVITTTGTPWEGLKENGCGWWVNPTVEGLRSAMSEALILSDEKLQKMGKLGHEYAKEFSWLGISKKMIETYRWLLEKGERPSFLYEATSDD